MAKYKIVLHTDGGCSPNPGPGSSAAIMELYKSNKLLKRRKLAWYLGTTTNNAAEILAVKFSLDLIENKNKVDLVIYLDSQWVADRITCKHKKLKMYMDISAEILTELNKFATVKIVCISRDDNADADGLVQLSRSLQQHIDQTEVV